MSDVKELNPISIVDLGLAIKMYKDAQIEENFSNLAKRITEATGFLCTEDDILHYYHYRSPQEDFELENRKQEYNFDSCTII